MRKAIAIIPLMFVIALFFSASATEVTPKQPGQGAGTGAGSGTGTGAGTGTGQTHTQPEMIAVTPDLRDAKIGITPVPPEELLPGLVPYREHPRGGIGLNLYLDGSKVHTENGVNLRQDDEICVGDIIFGRAEISGEYFTKGGNFDTPPILFVEDISPVISQINQETYSSQVDTFPICTWRAQFEKKEGPGRCLVDGAVICSSDCEIVSPDISEAGDNRYRISSAGEIRFEMLCRPQCILFVDREERELKTYPYSTVNRQYGYFSLRSPELEKALSKAFSITALENGRPSLKIEKVFPPGATNTARILIHNDGTAVLSIDFQLVPAGEVIYKPSVLKPGQKDDILVRVDRFREGLISATLEYTSKEKQCQETRKAELSFAMGIVTKEGGWIDICKSDAECETNTCCAGLCREPGAGICDDLDGDGFPETWVPK